jgi:hypothetical protein
VVRHTVLVVDDHAGFRTSAQALPEAVPGSNHAIAAQRLSQQLSDASSTRKTLE